jgi:hypothetical protein
MVAEYAKVLERFLVNAHTLFNASMGVTGRPINRLYAALCM